MDNNNQMIDKLKESVIIKLEELDSSKNHDSTLIDYILVMVVNQKSKYEMKHNLALFLGDIVDKFVNWLFDYLSQINNKDESVENEQNENLDKDIVEETINGENEEKENTSKEITTDSAVNDENKSINSVVQVVAPKKKLKSAIIVSDESHFKENRKTQKRYNEEPVISHVKKRLYNKVKWESNNIEQQSKNLATKRVDNNNTQENGTKFLVTLNDVSSLFKDNDLEEKDDLFLLGNEDFDPELMNEDLSNFHQKNDAAKEHQTNKMADRCKYWPSCMNSNCEFYHPVTKCNLFPNCRFGDKCMYIHPPCRFGALCSRKDCPFLHAAKRVPTTPTITCKYHPNCMNQFCEFYHPKICHYGTSCKMFNCPFTHPPPTQNIPHPSKMKWTSKSNTEFLDVNNKEEIEIK